VMAFSAIREAAGLGSLVHELRAVLDVQTAYFEARLARLAPRERAIVTTMALAPTNLKMKEIAKLSRLPERTLSTHMSRLEEDGHVRPALRPGGKGAVYELSEGLFRLWYQYRKGRPVLEPLVEILVYWYPLDELKQVVDALRQGTESSGRTRVAELALLQAEEALRRASSEEGQQARQQLWEECREALKREAEEAAPVSMNKLDRTARKALDEILALLQESARMEQGNSLLVDKLRKERSRSAQSFPTILMRVVSSVVGHVEVLGPEVAARALLSIKDAFHDDSSRLVQVALTPARLLNAHALYTHSPLEALAESDAVLSLGPAVEANKFIWGTVLFTRGAALKGLGREDEAIQVLEQFMVMADQVAKRHQILEALVLLDELYLAKKQLDRAGMIAGQIIERFGSVQEEPFLFRVAEARFVVVFTQMATPGDTSQQEAMRVIQAMDQWLEDYEGIESPQYWNARFIAKIAKAYWQARIGDSSGRAVVSECVQAVVEGKVKHFQIFFQAAIELFHVFGPEAMKEWLIALTHAALPEETRLLVSWHLMAAEVLLNEEGDDGNVGDSLKAPNEAWARIPPEIRPNVQDLVRQVSELRAERPSRAGADRGAGTAQ
jgi:DNA-binding transcriptional ArsR family regulator